MCCLFVIVIKIKWPGMYFPGFSIYNNVMRVHAYTVSSEVWKWPGYAGWYFVTLPKKLSADIRNIGKTYGAGFVKVSVTLGQTTWNTALFPHTDSEVYLISIKKNIRHKEHVWEGQKITLSFSFL